MYIRSLLVSGVSLALVLASTACGSVGSDGPDAAPPDEVDGSTADVAVVDVSTVDVEEIGDFTISVSPGSLDIPIGASKSTTVTVARVGAAGQVELSATDLPDGVTVSFETNPIPKDATTSKMTVKVNPGAVPGDSTFTVVGLSGGVEKTTTLELTAQTITVTGKVAGNRSGITVGMIGKASVTSGAGGVFTFTDVTPPYDLYTVAAGAFVGTQIVIYYDDLSRTDPVIDAASGLFFFPLGSTGDVSGNLTGGAAFDASHKGVALWDSTGGKDDTIAAGGVYSFTASWPQAASKTGNVVGLQWSLKANGAPDTFTGFGTKSTTLTAGGSTTAVNVPLAATQTATISGTIKAPSGLPAPNLTLTAKLGASISHVLWTAAATIAVDAGIPLTPGASSAIHAISTAGNGATTQYVHPGLTADTDVSFDLPTPPAQSAPVDAATGVTGATAFQFSGVPNAVHQVVFSSGGAKRTFQLITTATNVKIPVVPEQPLPANASFNWSVTAFGPHPTTNSAATDDGLGFVFAGVLTGSARFQAQSPSRSFTTAP
jgi:hypothetical protein